LALGLKLISGLFGAIELINTGAQFIQDSDFTSRFREIGQPEMDQLVRVYNRMADNLREERTRLQEQNFFLDRILAASPSGVITLDFDGRIAMANPAAERMLQASNGDLIGKKFKELASPFTAALDELKPGGSRIVPLPGRRRVKCLRSQFIDRGFTRDFVMLDELTEELRRIEKTAYERVIRMMSHEVNNSVGSANSLLHSCLNYAEQLQEADRGDFSNALSVIIKRTEQLNNFMRNFADVFRLPPPNLQACDLRSLLEDIVLLGKTECARRRIELKWDLPTAPRPVRLDRSQMELVLVNILKNAIEAIGEDGLITIHLGGRPGRIFVTIEDSGCGISTDVRPNLFTPFFSTKENGQGIGLTLVQEILDGHGFEFSLESQAGQSTRFTIYLSD
ncbi:MAG: PAS domain-containing protein, partial [Blastocatellia bacterium]|nr:PAS domain-containing protein [Blastocatellia bacterium]